MAPVKRILLVEDDETLGASLSERLNKEGYEVTWQKTAAAAEKAIDSNYDLAIVDIGLPDGSGFSVARNIKFRTQTKIIFLTAMTSAEYRLEGFELGADDYVPKPFHLRELLLRVAKVLEVPAGGPLRSGEIIIYPEGFILEMPGGKKEFLTQRDFECLRFLIASAPKAVSRAEILANVWSAEGESNPRTVDNAIVRLRAHLGEFEKYIRSVRGVGYQWVPGEHR